MGGIPLQLKVAPGVAEEPLDVNEVTLQVKRRGLQCLQPPWFTQDAASAGACKVLRWHAIAARATPATIAHYFQVSVTSTTGYGVEATAGLRTSLEAPPRRPPEQLFAGQAASQRRRPSRTELKEFANGANPNWQ